jgi:dienelactone hydrolase
MNPHTEDVARRFSLENFMAFAPDALTSVGSYPGDDYKGGQLFANIDGANLLEHTAPRYIAERLTGLRSNPRPAKR